MKWIAVAATLIGLAGATAVGLWWTRASPKPQVRPAVESPVTESPAEQTTGAETIPVERLIRVPDEMRRESGSMTAAPPPLLEQDSNDPGDAGPVQPYLELERERVESGIPTRGKESRKAGAGVRISPGDGDTSISVDGGVREDVYDQRPEEPERSTEVGISLEVPLSNRSKPDDE